MRQNTKPIKILLMITGHYFGNFIWTITAGLEMVKATVFKLTSETGKDTRYLIWDLNLQCAADKLTNMKDFLENYCMYQSFKLFI